MADSGTKDLGSILSDGLYRIPNYQRGYAWTSDEVNALLDDLEYVTENEAVNDHYLNSVIVTEAENQEIADVSHIIDGQQRLITSVLLGHEILRKTFSLASEEDQNHGQLKRNVEDKLYTDVFKSSPSRVQLRVLPAEEHEEIFRELVPDKLDEAREIEAIKEEAFTPSEQKLVEAVETISERLDELLNGGIESENVEDKLIYLDRLASTLHSDFTATLHEVDSSSEAGRIFEAINDRGRDLNRADKIKSYLVYRATLGDLDIDVEEIHETFTRIYEVLNEYASEPSRVDNLVDRLVGQHWNMFAGEDQISKSENLVGRHEKANKDLDQIKHSRYHVPKSADDTRVQKWIEVYLESLRNAAEAYVRFRGPDNQPIFDKTKDELAEDVDVSAVRHYLYAVETFGPSTTDSLSIVLYNRFGDTKQYEELLKALEKLVMRMFGVGGARRDTKRSDLESLSRVLFWAARDDMTDVFPEESSIPSSVSGDEKTYDIDGSEDDADQVTNLIEKWAHNYSHESEGEEEIDVFKRRLGEHNLEGLGVAGWGGLRTSELKNYMLYQYESEIRSGGAELPDYIQEGTGISDFTVEHVWPQTRSDKEIAEDLDDDAYAHYVERLGNLAFLSLSENSTAGNAEYDDKWESTYQNATDGTKMVRDEFPDPTGDKINSATKAGFDSWGTDVIEWRSEQMAQTLASYWECNS